MSFEPDENEVPLSVKQSYNPRTKRWVLIETYKGKGRSKLSNSRTPFEGVECSSEHQTELYNSFYNSSTDSGEIDSNQLPENDIEQQNTNQNEENNSSVFTKIFGKRR